MAYELLANDQPDTPIKEYTIRQWILSGQLPAVKAGKKYLINRMLFEEFLYGEVINDEQPG